MIYFVMLIIGCFLGVILSAFIYLSIIKDIQLNCKVYRELYREYYEKWFNLHNASCEPWHISKDIYYDVENHTKKELEDKIKDIYFYLDKYYGD